MNVSQNTLNRKQKCGVGHFKKLHCSKVFHYFIANLMNWCHIYINIIRCLLLYLVISINIADINTLKIMNLLACGTFVSQPFQRLLWTAERFCENIISVLT